MPEEQIRNNKTRVQEEDLEQRIRDSKWGIPAEHGWGQEIFLFFVFVHTSPGVQPPFCTTGIGIRFSGMWRLGRGVDKPPQSTAEVQHRNRYDTVLPSVSPVVRYRVTFTLPLNEVKECMASRGIQKETPQVCSSQTCSA